MLMNFILVIVSCTGVAGPLRVVPSPTGLPSKRGPGPGGMRQGVRGGRTSCAPGPEFLINLLSLALATKSAASSKSPAWSRKFGNPGILTIKRLGVR